MHTKFCSDESKERDHLVDTDLGGGIKKIRYRYPSNRPWNPIRLLNVEALTFCRQAAHMM
jgi:hypothetical protein